MDDKSRINMKSRILIVLIALEQENNVLLSDEWLDLWCVNTLKIKLHTDKKLEEFNKHFKHVKLTVRALSTNTLRAATD